MIVCSDALCILHLYAYIYLNIYMFYHNPCIIYYVKIKIKTKKVGMIC